MLHTKRRTIANTPAEMPRANPRICTFILPLFGAFAGMGAVVICAPRDVLVVVGVGRRVEVTSTFVALEEIHEMVVRSDFADKVELPFLVFEVVVLEEVELGRLVIDEMATVLLSLLVVVAGGMKSTGNCVPQWTPN